MKKCRFLLIGLLVLLSACTANPPITSVPVEDHGVIVEPETVEPTVTVTAIDDDFISAATGDSIENEVVEKPNKAVVPVSPSTIKSAPKNAAIIALLDSAKQQSQGGELRSAQTSLQRAQRIAPREPEVYFELAKVHLDLQDYGLAEQVALKGVSIVQGQPAQLHRFWLLIADIRAGAGNNAGAKKASELADRYK